MADQWSKYEVTGAEANKDRWSKYEVTPEVVKANTPAPEWFQPGSKSEAVVRGAANAATFGFGDEIQALIRTIGDKRTYKELRDEQRAANAASQEENPWSYGAGGVAGSLPQGLAILRGAALAGGPVLQQAAGAGIRGAGFGAVQGAGAAPELSDIPGASATGAAIGGATAAVAQPVAKLIGDIPNKIGAQKLMNTLKSNTEPARAAGTTVLTGLGKDQLIPSGLAIGNIGRIHAGEERPDWIADPYSAALDTAVAGGAGYLAGKALTTGIDLTGKAVPAIGNVIKGGLNKAEEVSANLVNKGSSNGVEQPALFGRLADFIKQSEGAANPEVQAAAQAAQTAAAQGATDDAKRKAAMDLSSSQEGRAVSNSESPVRDKASDFDFERWFNQNKQ